MTLKYTTAILFNRALEMDGYIPDYPTDTSKENVGTGNGSTTTFYLDKKGVIEFSESLYTGSTSESSATTLLTRDTHYTMDYNKSQITLTAAGLSSVSTDSIFSTYQYNKNSKINSHITEALERAEREIDNSINTLFVDSTLTTPGWGTVTNELIPGQGSSQRVYRTLYAPLNSTTTTSSGAVSAGANTIAVSSTNGFLSSGVFAIGTDKVNYTGKTTTQFTGCTSVLNAHTTNTTVTSYVVESAVDAEGTAPTWTVLQPDIDYSVDTVSGHIKLLDTYTVGDYFNPPCGVWDRVRVTYQYGYNAIYSDIVRCVHLIAAKELYSGQVLNAISRGTDGFSSNGINNIDEWIMKIINKYRIPLVSRINSNR